MITPANGSHCFASSGNGDVTAVVKSTDGSVSAQYQYAPFGHRISSMFPRQGLLWLAGDGLSSFDPRTQSLHEVGLSEGLAMSSPAVLAEAGGQLFVARDLDQLYGQDASSGRWQQIPVPPDGAISSGSGNPMRLIGAGNYLLLVLACACLYDTHARNWTNSRPRFRCELKAERGCIQADCCSDWPRMRLQYCSP